MKIIYDPQVDVLSIQFNNTPIEKSEPAKAGMLLNYDREGNVVKLEILNASQRVTNPQTVEYSVNLGQTQLEQEQENQSPLTLAERRAFLKLPLEKRRLILARQATEMVAHYQQNTQWQEFLAGDIVDY